jgi:adenylate kinase
MFENIAFIGGIHGVGKSTVCKQICSELSYKYLVASEVLKWREINSDINNKKVSDIGNTQDRLIQGLTGIIDASSLYLLDGHFCLLDINNAIVNVPLNTFININPISLNIIIGEVVNIKERLEKRDKRHYDFALLNEMKKRELEYAKEISTQIGITLNIGTELEFSDIFNSLKQIEK